MEALNIPAIERLAAQIKKELGLSHPAALDLLAQARGYQNWPLLLKGQTHVKPPRKALKTAPDDYSRELEAVSAVLLREPSLTSWGFGTPTLSWMSAEVHARSHRKYQAELLRPKTLASFRRAVNWLSCAKQTKHINRRIGSTSTLRSMAQYYYQRARPGQPSYILHGCFIAAALHLGFQLERIAGSTSRAAYLNISSVGLPVE